MSAKKAKAKLKLYLSPTEFDANNGVGQVIAAQRKHLPDLGFEFVDEPSQADIVAAHIYSPLSQVDVLHCHGLYWTGDKDSGLYSQWHHESNKASLETAKRARAITVPSQWVAEPFKRDMRISPVVIGHGLDLADWHAIPIEDRGNYLLWNKNRVSDVCDPTPAIELAKLGLPVVSTFGDKSIMQVTGTMSHEAMKDLLQHAGVYLANVKETFGIGILEALALGVPVLGYAHGGIVDLIQHKVNGYLVQPGDIEGLAQGYKWLIEHRNELASKCVASVKQYEWKRIVKQYVLLYQDVYARKQRPRTVGVVITNYNYEHYLDKAVQSVLAQTKRPDEIIVVDDGSTNKLTDEFINTCFMRGVKVIQQDNAGVAAARNNGIEEVRTDYVICLDADDWLEPTYVKSLFEAMEADRSLGVAYTGLTIHLGDGTSGQTQWPPEFDFDTMAKPSIPPANCIPIAAMFRRDMWLSAGGFRQEFAPGEDVEFWVRGLATGFNAKRVTNEPLFNYRAHSQSASRTKKYKPIDTWHSWMRNKSLMPMAAPVLAQPLVRSYSNPLVSVVIPVGPGHGQYLSQALDSLLAQTFTGWEVIVVDDTIRGGTGDYLDLKPYPFVRKFLSDGTGAGAARNTGLKHAKAPLVLWLDADDWLVPNAIREFVKGYVKSGGKYVYSDWLAYNDSDTKPEAMRVPDYDQQAWLSKGQHAVTALIETEAVRKVVGFDESLESWEDWDFFIRLAAAGVCGYRVDSEPLLVYRHQTGTRRLKALANGDKLYNEIISKWKDTKFMACCGGNKNIIGQAQAGLDAQQVFTGQQGEPGKVTLRYTGSSQAPITYFGRYQVARDGVNEYVNVNPEDVDRLLQLGKFAHVG